MYSLMSFVLYVFTSIFSSNIYCIIINIYNPTLPLFGRGRDCEIAAICHKLVQRNTKSILKRVCMVFFFVCVKTNPFDRKREEFRGRFNKRVLTQSQVSKLRLLEHLS